MAKAPDSKTTQTIGVSCSFSKNKDAMAHGNITIQEKVNINNKKALVDSLLNSIIQMQKSCNDFLTNEIDKEKNKDGPPRKRQRT